MGIVGKRQRAAENGNLYAPGARDQRARDQVRSRHQPVGGPVMLVDGDDVEAESFGRHQLIELGLVFIGAFLRIVKAVGQCHPGRAMPGTLVEIERPVMRWKQANCMGHTATCDESSRQKRSLPGFTGFVARIERQRSPGRCCGVESGSRISLRSIRATFALFHKSEYSLHHCLGFLDVHEVAARRDDLDLRARHLGARRREIRAGRDRAWIDPSCVPSIMRGVAPSWLAG